MAKINWIKLSVNIFDDEKIKLIRKMPEGNSIILIWIQLLCMAGKTNDSGAVYMGQNMYYTDEMLATICDQPLNTIRLALETFRRFEMIEHSEEGLITIENWEKHQNIEGMERVKTGNAGRQRLYYWRKKLLSIGIDPYQEGFTEDVEEMKKMYENKNLTLGLTLPHRPDIDKDIDKDIDIELDNIFNDNNKPNIGDLTDKEKKSICYYYRFLKNNTSKNDMELVVNSIKNYGWQKVLYTLWYLKEEQKSNVTSFKYVEKVLARQKEIDPGIIDFVANRELKLINEKGNSQ